MEKLVNGDHVSSATTIVEGWHPELTQPFGVLEVSDGLNHASGPSLQVFEALLVNFSERSPDGVSILEERPDYCLEEQRECDLVEKSNMKIIF